jgi:hypothetical protein
MGIRLTDDSSCSSVGTQNNVANSQFVVGPVDMMRKAVIFSLRNRKSISVAAYAVLLCGLAVLVYDPTYLDVIFPFIARDATSQRDGDDASDAAQRLFADGIEASTVRSISIRKLYDLPFVPRDFHCDEMHMKVREKIPNGTASVWFIFV